MPNTKRHIELTLLERLQQRDSRAMNLVYELYWAPMLSHAFRMLQDEVACQDILQEVFLTLWDKAPTLRADTVLPAYLHTLVRNRVLSALAKEKVKTDHLGSFTFFAQGHSLAPDAYYIEQELAEEVDKEVAKMPEGMRQVYELSRIQQLSHQEISEILDISPHTVKRQINKVLSRLRQYIKQNHYFFLLTISVLLFILFLG